MDAESPFARPRQGLLNPNQISAADDAMVKRNASTPTECMFMKPAYVGLGFKGIAHVYNSNPAMCPLRQLPLVTPLNSQSSVSSVPMHLCGH